LTSGWSRQADAVFRGGGVQGLALVGALQAFEAHERFPVETWVSVAGTSAGAVLASYLAYDRRPGLGERMRAIVDPERLASLLDVPFGRRFVGGMPRLLARRGMAPGRAFETWFDDLIRHATFALTLPPEADGSWEKSRLKLIACDATHRRLLVFPEDLVLYRVPGQRSPIDPAGFPIARAVRMSMSIPYFFEPVTLERIADDDGRPIPPRPAAIVDGAVVSNFPVWLFDTPHPVRPTFGFTVQGGIGVTEEPRSRLVPWPVRFALDVAAASREAWDARFVSHSTNVRTVTVNTTVVGADGQPFPVRSTDFDLPRTCQDALFENGYRAGTAFLDRFDPHAHVNTFHATAT
jgi:NTE family protein